MDLINDKISIKVNPMTSEKPKGDSDKTINQRSFKEKKIHKNKNIIKKNKPQDNYSLINSPKNAFMCFFMDKKQREIASREGLKGKDIISKLGEMWRGMSFEEKKTYEEMTLKVNKRNEIEMKKGDIEKKGKNAVKKNSVDSKSEEESKKKKIVKVINKDQMKENYDKTIEEEDDEEDK